MFQENRTKVVGRNTGKQILISYGDKNGSCAMVRKAVSAGRLRAPFAGTVCREAVHGISVLRRKTNKVSFDAPFSNFETS